MYDFETVIALARPVAGGKVTKAAEHYQNLKLRPNARALQGT